MNITDGIRINGKHSYGDFGLYLKSRNIGLPEQKSIRETVPFMNGYYDFSALNGAPAWNERVIEYAFDVVYDTPADLDFFVSYVLGWLGLVHDADIFDDTVYGYHWHGSYKEAKVAWDESGLHAEIAVSFVVHPFKIANEAKAHSLTAGTHTIINSGMAVSPYAQSDADAAIQIGNYVSSIPANEEIQLEIDLERGENTVLITGEGTVTLSYFEEVL